MTPALPAVVSAVLFEMGGIGNDIWWSPFTYSPTPTVVVGLIHLGASMGPGRPYGCLAQGVRVLAVHRDVAA